MNGYEYITPNDRRWLAKFMKEVKWKTAYSLLNEDFSGESGEKDKMRTKQGLIWTSWILVNLEEEKEQNPTTKIGSSDYSQISEEDAEFIYKLLAKLKKRTVEKMKTDKFINGVTEYIDEVKLRRANEIIRSLEDTRKKRKAETK